MKRSDRTKGGVRERTIEWRERYAWVEERPRTVGEFLRTFRESNKVLENLGERLNAGRWLVHGVKLNGGGYSSKPGNYQRNLALGKLVAAQYRNETIVVLRRFIPAK